MANRVGRRQRTIHDDLLVDGAEKVRGQAAKELLKQVRLVVKSDHQRIGIRLLH